MDPETSRHTNSRVAGTNLNMSLLEELSFPLSCFLSRALAALFAVCS